MDLPGWNATILLVFTFLSGTILICLLWWPTIVDELETQMSYFPIVERNVCRVDYCGQTAPEFKSTRIIKGRLERKDEFPFFVSFWNISIDSCKMFCGGSMINDRWIVTAAHCLENRNFGQIRMSVSILYAKECKKNTIPLENHWHHPLRDAEKNFYDIALVKTSVSIAASSRGFVNPACLPFNDMVSIASNFVMVSGFGRTEENGPGSSHLRTAQLDVLPMSNCYRFPSFRANSMTCAGDFGNLSDTCQGDSGSGLMMKNKEGLYVIIGLTSFGHGCGRDDTSAVYTKISYYLDWICSTMSQNGLKY